MTELVVDRTNILRSKRQESQFIATARKRKLRELYSITTGEPVPQILDLNFDAAPTSAEEAHFLSQNDILQHRILNEKTIPPRRHLRSDTARNVRSTTYKHDAASPVSSHQSIRGQHEDGHLVTRATSRKATPTGSVEHGPEEAELKRQGRLPSNGIGASSVQSGHRSVDDRSAEMLHVSQDSNDHEIVRTAQHDHQPAAAGRPASISPVVEEEADPVARKPARSAASPGIELSEVVPVSSDEAGQLPDFLFVAESNDSHHKAATIHLPPKDVQEQHLRDVDQSIKERTLRESKEDRSKHLSITLPPSSTLQATGQLSSPGSTVGAHSATTPGLQETSTDTSPEGDTPRYNALEDKAHPYPRTPPELRPSPEEVAEKARHDRALKAQLDLVRNDVLGSSPTSADAQLRLEQQQAVAASSIQQSSLVNGELEESLAMRRSLTRSAGEIVQDIVEDENENEDKVAAEAPTAQSTTASESVAEVKSEQPGERLLASGEVVEESSNQVGSGAGSAALVPGAGPICEDGTDTTPTELAADESSTDSKVPPTTSSMPERTTTRVSSGAIQSRTVSESSGGMPKLMQTTDKSLQALSLSPQSRTIVPQSSGNRRKSLLERARGKEKSRLSTVVFAKPATHQYATSTGLSVGSSKDLSSETRDYFMPLIMAQAYSSARGIQPLDSLLQSAHKTITTSNAYVPFHDHQTQRILRRIHNLQSQDKWSFRQPKRANEPNRPTAHWDEMMKEMKWMRTDFREERKWKTAVARNLSCACAEWVASAPEDRKLLQVKSFIPSPSVSGNDKNVVDETSKHAMERMERTPDLVHSAEQDSLAGDFDEEPSASLLDAIAPTSMFTMNDDDVIFGLRRSAATDKLLEELPMYGTPLQVPRSDLPTSDIDPDASWKRPALPISKFVDGKLLLLNDGPPKKRSRFQYEEESEDEDASGGTDRPGKRLHVDPLQVDVALFNPENKHIRDRIHAGHQFRPPSESPMPLQSFFESRSSSHWLLTEDDELRALVREYSYNWQLISSILTNKSLFASGFERRTPWECFERWIHLEGLPADMQKTHYFRAYNNRLEAAQRALLQQAAQAPAPPAGTVAPPPRRKSTTSIRVDRKRASKHLTLVDAMRKLAKKRETTAQKQQHAAGLAAMRKANDAPPPQGARHTPQDFSRLKHERELQMQERLQRLQMQQEAQRRALQQARNAQHNTAQQYGGSNSGPNVAGQAPRTASANTPGAAQHPSHSRGSAQLAVPGHNLPHPPLQTLPNGLNTQPQLTNGHTMPNLPMKGAPQAQMNMPGIPNIQGQHRLPAPNAAPDLRLVMQARQISEQQRQAVQMQQQTQQQHNQHPVPNQQIHNSSPNMRTNVNTGNQQSFMQNSQAMMAPFNQNTANVSTPGPNGINTPNGAPAGSPRSLPQSQSGLSHPGQGAVPHITKLEAQYRGRFPNASPEQIQKAVGEELARTMNRQQISQQAMHAAAGNGIPAGVQHSPQQYAQMLRAQQERQAQANQNQHNRSASVGSGMGK